MGLLISAAERGMLPDPMLRGGIRYLLRQRLRQEKRAQDGNARRQLAAMVAAMDDSPIAAVPELANEEHYTLPPAFFQLFLGRWRKYSSGFWADDCSCLDDAEAAMLDLTCRRAGLEDGMTVLDLGCGWGSLSLWIARYYPKCTIVSVSNSPQQRAFIQAECRTAGITNIQVVTADMNSFAPGVRFQRIISVEMFEHMRDYRSLLGRVRSWLEDDGKLFLHIFCHRRLSYFFEPQGEGDWMARYFFTGGIMPSASLLRSFSQDMMVTREWPVNGVHYQKTLEAWLENLDQQSAQARRVLTGVYPQAQVDIWLQRWRIFMMACSELFGFADGEEWRVGHYLLEPSPTLSTGGASCSGPC